MHGASHCADSPSRGGPLETTDASSTPSASGATSPAPDDSGGWIPPQRRHFVLRRTSGFRCGPSSRRGRRSPSSPAGCPGTGRQAALLDHARPAGWANAPARGMLALWLTISPQGWPPTGFTTPSPSMSWPGRCRPSWLRWLAPQRFLCYPVSPGFYFHAALVRLPCHLAGYQACHRPARHWRDTLLHLRSPGCDALSSAVGSPGPPPP